MAGRSVLGGAVLGAGAVVAGLAAAAAGVGALATLALEGLGTAAAGTLAAVAEQGVAGEPLCLPCAFKAGGVAGALTVLTLGVGRVPAVQRFAGRMGTWLGETRLGLWAKAAGGKLADAARRLGMRAGGRAAVHDDVAVATSGHTEPAVAGVTAAEERPLYMPKRSAGELEPGAVPGVLPTTQITAPELPPGWPETYDLRASDRTWVNTTFGETPRPDVLAPGTKIYRIVDADSNPAGSFWTLEPPPQAESPWRAGAAVKNEWNGDGAYVEHTVGGEGLPVWRGKAAPQEAARKGYVLPGGGEQLYVPPNSLTPSAPSRTPWNPGS